MRRPLQSIISASDGIRISLPTFTIFPSRKITVQFSIVPFVIVYTVALVSAAVTSLPLGICAVAVTVISDNRIKQDIRMRLIIRGFQKAVQRKLLSSQGTRHNSQGQ